jgi:hypothetical protein
MIIERIFFSVPANLSGGFFESGATDKEAG